jgi:pyridoxamine 5'-phosphate oxidase
VPGTCWEWLSGWRSRRCGPDHGTARARRPDNVGVEEFARPLRKHDVDPSPITQFHRWFREATDGGVRAPEAAVVATATRQGAPSARMVLVKQADQSGFVFFTNYDSRKANELASNPRAALLFDWDRLGRQVRIEGPVQRTTVEESAAYARSRPRGSQLSALASQQSRTVSSREALEERVAELARRYQGADLPLSDGWGGFRLMPRVFEFWQHREDRLHDRLRYTPRGDGSWLLERLSP